MRPEPSVSGTRCTRCTPDSNFSFENAPRPRISTTISLNPPMAPSLAEMTSLLHAEQIAREDCRLVAAGAGANFKDHVAIIHRVLGQQCRADFLFERSPS